VKGGERNINVSLGNSAVELRSSPVKLASGAAFARFQLVFSPFGKLERSRSEKES